MSIDRKALVEGVLEGLATTDQTFVPPTSLGKYTDIIEGHDLDERAAKALLDEAGWVPGSDGRGRPVPRAGEPERGQPRLPARPALLHRRLRSLGAVPDAVRAGQEVRRADRAQPVGGGPGRRERAVADAMHEAIDVQASVIPRRHLPHLRDALPGAGLRAARRGAAPAVGRRVGGRLLSRARQAPVRATSFGGSRCWCRPCSASRWAEARPYLSRAPKLMLFPGLAIFLTALAFNLVGDGLRDALDPKTRRLSRR